MKQKTDAIIEEEEFLRVVDQCKSIITKICYFYADDSEKFKDLRQDVLAAMWYSRASFRGQSNVTTWVYRIALNTCISAMRKHKRTGQRVPLESLPEMAVENDDKMSRHKLIYNLINQLKGDDKAIILLWLDELPYEEIASIMGLPRNTLATRIRRIKLRLAELANNEN